MNSTPSHLRVQRTALRAATDPQVVRSVQISACVLIGNRFFDSATHLHYTIIARGEEAEPHLRTLSQSAHLIFGSSLVDPRLRASNEHIHIVRVPQAGGRQAAPPILPEAARCASN
jgi:hypothetical protein